MDALRIEQAKFAPLESKAELTGRSQCPFGEGWIAQPSMGLVVNDAGQEHEMHAALFPRSSLPPS